MKQDLKKRLLILGADALFVLALLWFDRFTKTLAVTHLKGQEPFVLIDGVLEFSYLENRGAAFGIFQGQRIPLLIAGAVCMVLLIVWLMRLPRGRKFLWIHFLVSLILAGGMGNLIDRWRGGYVVDFIYFVLIDYPVFNVADSYVVCAAIGLVILFLFVFGDEDWEAVGLAGRKK